MLKTLSLTIAVLFVSQAIAPGAELQMRAKCQPKGVIVTVGDVAEIRSADPQEARALAAVELFPSPAPGQQRIVRVRELQDLLAMRTVNLAEHRLSGASQVVVLGPGETARPDDSRPVSPLIARRAERLVQEAVVRFIQEQTTPDESWSVRVALDESQAKKIPGDSRGIAVSGGRPPWTGSQQFELVVDSPTQPTRLAVTVEVSPRPPVVVTTVALPAGAVIRPGDVKLQPAPADNGRGEGLQRVEDVVGRELVRSITAGSVLQQSLLRAPTLIRRGEVITIYARSPGVCVRITARARQDAGLGELVTVESLLDRKLYAARVSGAQEAEVYARAVRAQATPPRGLAVNAAGTLGEDQPQEGNGR
jgi:flagella basal body P-ring formation protein FlgA